MIASLAVKVELMFDGFGLDIAEEITLRNHPELNPDDDGDCDAFFELSSDMLELVIDRVCAQVKRNLV